MSETNSSIRRRLANNEPCPQKLRYDRGYADGLDKGKYKAIEVLDRYLGNLKDARHSFRWFGDNHSFKIAHKQLLLEIKRELQKK